MVFLGEEEEAGEEVVEDKLPRGGGGQTAQGVEEDKLPQGVVGDK